MPTATARGNITSETPVLASLVGPDDVVPATHQQRRAFGDGACSPMACKKRRALETPSHAALERVVEGAQWTGRWSFGTR
jgi:hypothetical protein